MIAEVAAEYKQIKTAKMKNWTTNQKTIFWIVIGLIGLFIYEMKWLGNTHTFTGLNARQFCGGGYVGTRIQTEVVCPNGYDVNGNCLPSIATQRPNVIVPERVPVIGVYN